VTDATLTAAEGVGEVRLEQRSLTNIPRSLYLYENIGVQPLAIAARSLYLFENIGVQIVPVAARSLYLYENRGIQALAILARSLYLYEATRDSQVFPWLMKLDPTAQYPGGQVNLYGDGLGELSEVGAAATITASSTNGSNIPANAVSRTAAEWVSNDGTGAWLRFTFGAAKTLYAIALEDRATATWGLPLFRFSDLGADVVGVTAVPAPAGTTEVPVGVTRTLYVLPAERTVTWVEIRVSSGGSGTNRGLSEAWVWADADSAAEPSTAFLGALTLGIAAWANRSPGLWPANGGLPITPAATVTLPPNAASGLVKVTEP
jgi:hypothetical protein